MTWNTDFCGENPILQTRRVRTLESNIYLWPLLGTKRLSAPTWPWTVSQLKHETYRKADVTTCWRSRVLQLKTRPLSLRSATYAHRRGPVPRPEVRLRSVSGSGHRLLILLWCDPAQTQVETGTGPSGWREPDVLPFSPSNTRRVPLCRCQTWVARHSPSCSMTSITPCARPTARPSLHSPTLRSL